MNAAERIKMIKCMDFICRNLSSEEYINLWSEDGVANGEVEYGDLRVKEYDEEDLSFYLDDVHFADTMEAFLRIVKKVKSSGGLCCDGVFSKAMKR